MFHIKDKKNGSFVLIQTDHTKGVVDVKGLIGPRCQFLKLNKYLKAAKSLTVQTTTQKVRV